MRTLNSKYILKLYNTNRFGKLIHIIRNYIHNFSQDDKQYLFNMAYLNRDMLMFMYFIEHVNVTVYLDFNRKNNFISKYKVKNKNGCTLLYYYGSIINARILHEYRSYDMMKYLCYNICSKPYSVVSTRSIYILLELLGLYDPKQNVNNMIYQYDRIGNKVIDNTIRELSYIYGKDKKNKISISKINNVNQRNSDCNPTTSSSYTNLLKYYL